MNSSKQRPEGTLTRVERIMKSLWKDLEPKNTLNTSFFISQDVHKKFRYLTLLINTITFIWTLNIVGTEIIPTHFSLLQFLTIWGFLICYLYSILVVLWQDAPDNSHRWKFTYILGEVGFALQLMICPFFFIVLFPTMVTVLKIGFWEILHNILIHGIVPLLVWLETLFNGMTFPRNHRVVLNWVIVTYLINNLIWTIFNKRPVYPPVDWISAQSYILKVFATLAVIGGFILGGKIYSWKKDKYLHHTNSQHEKSS